MSCRLYNNNGYGCGGCIHFVKTNSVTLQGNVLTLNIPQASYSNKERSKKQNTKQINETQAYILYIILLI